MIIKRKLKAQYVTLPNAVLMDTNMSTDARWCLSYLLTRPVDWEVMPHDIRDLSGWGRDKTKDVLNELILNRYLEKAQARNPDGSYANNRYYVYDEPQPLIEIPSTEKPFTENPSTVNPSPTYIYKDILNTDITNEDLGDFDKIGENEGVLTNSEAQFEEFWSAYPDRDEFDPMPAARAAFKNALQSGASFDEIMGGVKSYYEKMQKDGKIGTQFVSMAFNWLNNRRWERAEKSDVDPNMTTKRVYCGTDEWKVLKDEFYLKNKRLMIKEMEKVERGEHSMFCPPNDLSCIIVSVRKS